MDEDRQTPVIDLHESEWRRDGKHEPILGPNGRHFLVMIPVTIVVVIAVKALFEVVLWPLLWPH